MKGDSHEAVTECNLISGNQIELVFNREVKDLVCQLYQWKTLTLMVKDVKLYQGYIGSDVTGFTQKEMEEPIPSRSPVCPTSPT